MRPAGDKETAQRTRTRLPFVSSRALLAALLVLVGVALAIAVNLLTEQIPDRWAWANNWLVQVSLVVGLTVVSMAAAWRHEHQIIRQTSDLPPEKPATPVTNLPPRNPHFTGRIEQLARLTKLLDDGSTNVVALQGLGGIGKSQLALEFAHLQTTRRSLTWWIRASNRVEIATDLVALAYALNLDISGDTSAAISVVRSALASRTDWLMVFDNAVDEDAVRDYLPPGPGKIVITSRGRNWGGLAHAIDIDLMTEDEAVQLIALRTGKNDTKVKVLATELGYLPLALSQAAAYVTVHGISIGGYLKLYHQAKERLLAAPPRPADYPQTVATTWLMHFEMLSEPATDLLHLTALLAPDSIPLETLLTAAPPGSMPGSFAVAVEDPIERNAVVGELTSSSLVTRIDDHTIRVHRLVQDVTRGRLSKADTTDWTNRIADIILAAVPTEPWLLKNWDQMHLLAPHAEAVARRIGLRQRKPLVYKGSQLLSSVATFLSSKGDYATAKNLLDDALVYVRASETPKRLGESPILDNLGIVLTKLEDYVGAVKAHNRAFELRRMALGPAHPLLVSPLINIANICLTVRDAAGAKERLELAFHIKMSSGGESDLETVGILISLGIALTQLKDYAPATVCLDQAVELATNLCGSRDPHVAAALLNRAELAWKSGDQKTADSALSDAIRIYIDQLGPEHPETKRAMSLAKQLRSG